MKGLYESHADVGLVLKHMTFHPISIMYALGLTLQHRPFLLW